MAFVWFNFGVLSSPEEDDAYLYAVNSQGNRRKLSKRAYPNHNILKSKMEKLVGKPCILRTSQNTKNWSQDVWFSDVSISYQVSSSPNVTSTVDSEIESSEELQAKISELEKKLFRSSEDISALKLANSELIDASINKLISEHDSEVESYRAALDKAHHQYDERTKTFLATVETLEKNLPTNQTIDWSCGVILFCKAVENELVKKFLEPMKNYAHTIDKRDIEIDKKAKRLEEFLFGLSPKPPELGGINFYINLVARSSKFQKMASSALFDSYLKSRANAVWYTDPNGAVVDLKKIINYRNPAAHIDELSASDFSECKLQTIGASGVLQKICEAAKVNHV